MVPAVAFTLAEAATILDPPMTERQLRQIVSALGWEPDGHRYTGCSGRPVATYRAERILKLHGVLVSFLEVSG